MNSTSCSSRLLTIAARSAARSIAGPEVTWTLTPSSRAMMCASEVLPRPGGPANSTWSSTSARPRAASIDMPSIFLVRSCPMNSEMARGRSARSMRRSSSWPTRAVSRPSATGGGVPAFSMGLLFAKQHRQRLADYYFGILCGARICRDDSVDRALRLNRFHAEIHQRGDRFVSRTGRTSVGHGTQMAVGRAGRWRRHLEVGDFVAQFAHYPLRDLRADARYRVYSLDIALPYRSDQFFGREH